jgi:hypothetical protein
MGQQIREGEGWSYTHPGYPSRVRESYGRDHMVRNVCATLQEDDVGDQHLLNRCQEDFERGWVAKEATAAAAATKALEDEAAASPVVAVLAAARVIVDIGTVPYPEGYRRARIQT